MTQKKIGYVELQWGCPHCGHKNPGRATTCQSCGAAQPADVAFEQPAQEILLNDEASQQQAKSGPDIHCAYCGTRNPAGTVACKQCGADLAEGVARAAGQVVGAHQAAPVGARACPACGTMNPGTAVRCQQCQATLGTTPAPPATPAPPRRGATWSVILVGAGVVLCLFVALMALRSEEVIGQVTAVAWQRQVHIEAQGPVERQDWYDDIPTGANINSCQEKIHHTQANPAPGAIEVCGTPYTVDQGSGLGEVVQDCQYEVYADWCNYTVIDWQEVDVITTSGTDLSPYWPEPTLPAGQRPGNRDEKYTCTFDTDGDSYTYTTQSSTEFSQCTLGSQWILHVNAFNAVRAIEPDK